MKPCPCGYHGVDTRCCCSPQIIQRYQQRISGPLVDRIDMHVLMPRISLKELNEADHGEPSAAVRERVTACQSRQLDRQGVLNASLNGDAPNTQAAMNKTVRALLESASEQLGLSTRACHRVQRLTRTIADLAGSQTIAMQHLAEAIQYRQLDRLPMQQGRMMGSE